MLSPLSLSSLGFALLHNTYSCLSEWIDCNCKHVYKHQFASLNTNIFEEFASYIAICNYYMYYTPNSFVIKASGVFPGLINLNFF